MPNGANLMRKFCYFAFIIFCTPLLVTSLLWGQATTGSIYGRVSDPTGALVVGAQVKAVNQSTGVVFNVKSDGQGNYTLFNLPPGIYNVSAEKDGFELAALNNVRLVIDQKQLLDFALKIGSITTTDTITAAPTLLQTQSAETGDVIQSHDILNLPLLGRNFYDLTALSAGVTPVGGSISGFSYSISGSREYANSIQVDGVESTSNRNQDATTTPSVDAVEEFKVSTSGYSAEFGRSAGGVISIQTKSGTNGYHGDAYEFFRPNFTTAKQYGFNGSPIPPSILKQHNYGGTFGGPIRKDKAFFFVSYEGIRNTDSYNYVDSTPPLGQIQFLPDGSVDLSGLVDPITGNQIPIYDPAVSVENYGGWYQQFPGNILPADRVSKAGVNTLLNFFPAPNLPGIDNGWYDNFLVNSPVNYKQKNGDGRYDQTISDKDRFSVVYHYNDSDSLTTDPYWGHTTVVGGGDADQANNQTSSDQELSVTETHLFSNRLLNEFRFGFTHFNLAQYSLLNNDDLSTKYGVGNIAVPGYPATDSYPYIFLGAGYLTGGSTYKPLYFRDSNFQFADNVILSGVGKHEFKFGADVRLLNSHPNFSLFPTGFQYFGGPYYSMTSDWSYSSPLNDYSALYATGGSDIADLLLGLPVDVYMGLQLTNPHTKSWEMHYYAQDVYKVTPRLTLNYGLRYEYQAPYTEENNYTSNYDPATDSILLAGKGSNSASLQESQKTNFAPRLGFAYQLNKKTVLRGGWGMFFTPENDAREDLLTKNYPFNEQQQFTNLPYNGPASSTDLYQYVMDTGVARSATIPIPSGASSIPTADIVGGSLYTTYYVNPKMRTGYSENYNLALQRELGSNFTVEAAYVGAKSHLLSYEVGNLNVNNVVTANLGIVQGLEDWGWGEYNSLQVKVTKRVSDNLNFQANYTYSHNLDNGPAPFDLGHINSDNPQNPYDLNAEIASADSDIRHNFVFSGLYHLPVGRGQKFFATWGRVPEFVLGGWQLNAILNARTGTPINVIRDGSNATCPGARPNQVGDPYAIPQNLSSSSAFYYFNPGAFSSTGLSGCDDPGDVGRNSLVGLGYINLDSSIFKEFSLTERAKLQTRFELFNTMNTPHFSNPNADEGQPASFGQITRTYGHMRVIQLAAKIIF
jgi:outer membrane receptor protein involved in Fe transport